MAQPRAAPDWIREGPNGAGERRWLASPCRCVPGNARAGWDEAEYRPMFEEALRLRRAPRMAWLWRLLALFASKKRREEFKRFSGVVLLQRQS